MGDLKEFKCSCIPIQNNIRSARALDDHNSCVKVDSKCNFEGIEVSFLWKR